VTLLPSIMALAEAPPGTPVTIGFSMPLTGGLAVNGTSGLLAMQIWAEDTNKKGGLLGRPVKLVYYDDQTNPSLVPGIYTKLLDVDKVDLVVSAYGTNVTAPALPVVIQHNKTFMGLFAMDVNEEFRYPKYFSMLPVGPDPRAAISEGFFEIVKANKEKLGLKTIALAVDDGEATRNTADGARVNLKKTGLQVVYDKTYPPTTTDFTPIIRAIQATNPDIVYIASYPPDSVGLIRAMHELGLNTKVCCGTMTGPQSTSIKTSLGPMSTASSPSTFGCRLRNCASPESWTFCSAISSRPQARASTRSAIISRLGPMPISRSWGKPLRVRRASIRTKSLITSAPIPSRPSSGTSSSVKKASGKRPGL
jgi:branched-chain amino acid transport system substrate-binding protein